MPNLWVLQQVRGQRHDDGDAGLVVAAQERAAAGGDEIFAARSQQVGMDLGVEHLSRVVGQDNRLAVPLAMHDRLDVLPRVIRRGVHVSEECDRGHTLLVAGGRDAGQYIAVFGERYVRCT